MLQLGGDRSPRGTSAQGAGVASGRVSRPGLQAAVREEGRSPTWTARARLRAARRTQAQGRARGRGLQDPGGSSTGTRGQASLRVQQGAAGRGGRPLPVMALAAGAGTKTRRTAPARGTCQPGACLQTAQKAPAVAASQATRRPDGSWRQGQRLGPAPPRGPRSPPKVRAVSAWHLAVPSASPPPRTRCGRGRGCRSARLKTSPAYKTQ